MRVRKMNQVDVKLHDLTKVKLKKYRLNWEETGNPVPRIRNWMERLDYQAVQRRELAKLPERTIHFLEENQDTLFSFRRKDERVGKMNMLVILTFKLLG